MFDDPAAAAEEAAARPFWTLSSRAVFAAEAFPPSAVEVALNEFSGLVLGPEVVAADVALHV